MRVLVLLGTGPDLAAMGCLTRFGVMSAGRNCCRGSSVQKHVTEAAVCDEPWRSVDDLPCQVDLLGFSLRRLVVGLVPSGCCGGLV